MDWEYVSRAVGILLDRHMHMAIRPSEYNSGFGDSLYKALIGLRNAETMLEFRGDVNYKRKRDLALVLDECSSFQSTDPRDKVFALLGLTTDNSKNLIKPNYDKEYHVKQVYIDAMLFILAESDNPMQHLEGAGIGTERSAPELRDLPSWVPDWNLTTPFLMSAKSYTSGTQYEPKINMGLSNGLMISLEGLQIDQIKILGRSAYSIGKHEGLAKDTSYMAEWLAEAEALAKAQRGNTYQTAELFLEDFIRTVLGNKGTDELDRRPSTEQCHADYQAAKEFFAATARMSQIEELGGPITSTNYVLPFGYLDYRTVERANRFTYFFETAVSFRKFCVTEEGRMAIVPAGSAPGDVICIFKGARTPFLLRRVADGESDVYKLVGSCYVHGVMDGEKDIEQSKAFVLV
jgi:hypothetical protein